MNDFNEDIKAHNFERGIIKDKVAEFYDRMDIDAQITVEHRVMNHYEVTVTYTDKRLGNVKTYYTVLLRDGRVEFQ